MKTFWTQMLGIGLIFILASVLSFFISDLKSFTQWGIYLLIGIPICVLIAYGTAQGIEKKNKEKEIWYEQLLDKIPLPLSVTDMNMNWTFINKPVEDFLKINRKEIVGKPCHNWGAAICKTEKCGIHRLRKNNGVTFFSQMGGNFRVDTHYLYTSKNIQIGHIEVVQDITSLYQLSQSVKEINQIGEQLNLSFKEIAKSAEVLASGASEQAASLQEIVTRISELSEQTQKTAVNSDQASTKANHSTQIADQGDNQVHQLVQAIQEVNTSFNEIKDINKMIDDIADQTNLLALNAAIEAARAGDAGRGFAVVADEVRKLAEKSATAVKETTSKIDLNVKNIDKITSLVKLVANNLSEIKTSNLQAAEMIDQISIAGKEQSAGLEQISRSIEQIDQAVQSSAASTEQVASTTQEITQSIENLIQRMNIIKITGMEELEDRIDSSGNTNQHPKKGLAVRK